MKRIFAMVLIAIPCMAGEDFTPVEDRIAKVTVVTKTETTPICTVYVSQHKKSWRFCHNGLALQVVPFWSDGETTGKKQIVECPTLAEARTKIETMGLKTTEKQALRIAELKPVPELAAEDKEAP